MLSCTASPMLPSGLRLPLLWLLLWTPGLLAKKQSTRATVLDVLTLQAKHGRVHPRQGLFSSPSQGNELTDWLLNDLLTLYDRTGGWETGDSAGVEAEPTVDNSTTEVTRVSMVDIKSSGFPAIYKRSKKNRHSVYMVFNITELWEAVPDPSSLYRTDLLIHKLKQHQQQHAMLFEKYRRNSWHYLSHRLLAPSNTAEWITFDVTDVVRQWLSHRGEIKAFQLTGEKFADGEDNVLYTEISGLTPTGRGDLPNYDRMNRPFLLLQTTPLHQADHPSSSQQH